MTFQNNKLLIKGARLIDGTGAPTVPRADILIEDGKFSRILTDRIEVSDGTQIIEAAGATVLPGLIDMHAHLISGGFDTVSDKSMSYELADQQRALKQMLYWGVTSVYSPVQPLDSGLQLRDLVRKNAFPSPRLFISGPGFTAPQGWAGSNFPSARLEPASIGQVKEQVGLLADAGVDILKAFYEDMECAFCAPVPKLDLKLMEAIVAEAHEHSLQVMVHVYDTQSHKDVIRCGANIMAHSAITDPVDDEYIEMALKNKTLYLATLCVYHDVFDETVIRDYISQDFVRETVPQKTLETLTAAEPLNSFERSIRQENIKRLLPTIMLNLKKVFDAGVPLAVGPDTGVPGAFPGLAVHREMELMAQAGIPTDQILVAATRTAAQYLGQDQLGSIEKGKAADAVILDGDPMTDVTNSLKIKTVIKDGSVVDREELLRSIME